MQATIRLTSHTFGSIRTYLLAALFIAGNIILPQIFHLIHLGGPTWLPIYFFTLIGAYMYGWRVGLLTAVASPIVNSVAFGMPAAAMLPVILIKSVILAGLAGMAASRFRKASLVLLIGVVLGYQLLGSVGEWILSGNLMLAMQDFRIGVPGMLLQVAGGWAVINFSKK